MDNNSFKSIIKYIEAKISAVFTVKYYRPKALTFIIKLFTFKVFINKVYINNILI
jgi:hypothetical protein